MAGNDPAKITQFNGLCELGKFDEYWLLALWEKEFETPGNAEPGWQPALLLEIQDDTGL